MTTPKSGSFPGSGTLSRARRWLKRNRHDSRVSSGNTHDSDNGGDDGDPEPSGAQRSNDTTASPSRMVSLAAKISREAARLETHMRDHGDTMPDFGPDSPPDYPPLPGDIAESRRVIISASAELRDLATGPRETLRWGVWDFLDIIAFQVLGHFEIAKLVPEQGTISLSDLARQTALDDVNLARLLRLAMTRRVFCEPSPAQIGHTAASRLLASDPAMQAWIGLNTEDFLPAAGHVLQSLLASPEATSPLQAGFNYAWGTAGIEPMFATFSREPARAHRLGHALSSMTGGEGYEVHHLVQGSAKVLGDVDLRGGTLVDVGGSHGFVSVDLARQHRRMRFIVQDLPRTIESAPNPVSEDGDVTRRIEFMAHDFFTDQVVKGADVYLLRWILHNHSKPYAVKILKSLVPALKPGARIIVNEHCLSPFGEKNEGDERQMRRMDALMLCLLNAQVRSEAEFRDLFRAADERMVFKGATRPPGSRMSIVEAVWEP
ncbi:hypothetical protein RB594_005085 [Gaeumannomyces avenae]